MKNLSCTFAFIFAYYACFAQVGVVAGYKTFNPSGWNEYFESRANESLYPMAGWQIGAEYWFRLKKRRIEFAPEVSYAQFSKKIEGGSFTHRQLGLHLNTDIYIFDLASDCNCPTFSKDGNVFGKGFFLELSPGMLMVFNEYAIKGSLLNPNSGVEYTFGGSAGVGLDLGLTKWLTITPMVRFHYYPNTSWDFDLAPASLNDDLKQVFMGLRTRMHFKELAKARYR